MKGFHQSENEIDEDALWVIKSKENSLHFEFLYKKYHNQIFKYIYHSCNAEADAADLTTDVFCIALNNIHKYKSMGLPFSAYLYRVAVNELNTYRKRNKMVLSVQLDTFQIQELHESEPVEEDSWLRCLTKSMQQLNEEDFNLLQFRFTENKSFKEIGSILNIPEPNAKTKIYRLFKKLRPLIQLCYAKI